VGRSAEWVDGCGPGSLVGPWPAEMWVTALVGHVGHFSMHCCPRFGRLPQPCYAAHVYRCLCSGTT